MQEAYYLPVSPDDNQRWEIQRDDKFLIEADQTINSFGIRRPSDLSSANVLRVSVIQKTPQPPGFKVGFDGIGDDSRRLRSCNNIENAAAGDDDDDVDDNGKFRIKVDNVESVPYDDAMEVEDNETLVESIWNDYPYIVSRVPSLENDLENTMISQELMVADIVHEQFLQSAAVNVVENEKFTTILQTVGLGLSLNVDMDVNVHDTFTLACRCCKKNFTFHDLKLHNAAKKSTSEGSSFRCDCCAKILSSKNLNSQQMIAHSSAATTAAVDQSFPELIPCTTSYNDSRPPRQHKIDDIEISFVEQSEIGRIPAADRPSTKRIRINFEGDNSETEERQLQTDCTIDKPLDDDKKDYKIEKGKTDDDDEECSRIHRMQCPKCKEHFRFTEEAKIDAYSGYHNNNEKHTLPAITTYYKCGFCDTVVTDRNEFNQHMNNHTTVVGSKYAAATHRIGKQFPYKCSYCENLAFETIEELTSHFEMHVPRRNRSKPIIACPKCGIQCLTQENKMRDNVRIQRQSASAKTTNHHQYNTAMQVTSRPKLKTTPILTPADKVAIRENLKCTTCTAVFRRQDDFNEHAKTAHAGEDITAETIEQEVANVKVDSSYCAYCSSKLLSIAEIIIHIRKHTEERKLFPCSNCDKKTTDRNPNGNTNSTGVSEKENLCKYCLSQNKKVSRSMDEETYVNYKFTLDQRLSQT